MYYVLLSIMNKHYLHECERINEGTKKSKYAILYTILPSTSFRQYDRVELQSSLEACLSRFAR